MHTHDINIDMAYHSSQLQIFLIDGIGQKFEDKIFNDQQIPSKSSKIGALEVFWPYATTFCIVAIIQFKY